MIIRGTTPTLTITTNEDLSTAAALYVTFRYGGNTVLEKDLDDVTINSNVIEVTLSQADTLALPQPDGLLSPQTISIQVRARLSDGTALACIIKNVPVYAILKEGEI